MAQRESKTPRQIVLRLNEGVPGHDTILAWLESLPRNNRGVAHLNRHIEAALLDYIEGRPRRPTPPSVERGDEASTSSPPASPPPRPANRRPSEPLSDETGQLDAEATPSERTPAQAQTPSPRNLEDDVPGLPIEEEEGVDGPEAEAAIEEGDEEEMDERESELVRMPERFVGRIKDLSF